jgi:diguanylate cyclase (GGDEF)-like protein
MPIPEVRKKEAATAPPAQSVTEPRLDDRSFRRGMIAMRWILLIAYASLTQTHVLDVSTTAFLLSGGMLLASTILFTWLRSGDSASAGPIIAGIRYLDVALVSAVLVALHDVRSPVWSVYLISIVAIAHLASTKGMVAFASWVGFNYVAAAFVVKLYGYDVPWSYVIVVSICIQVMAINASVVAGSEQRLRGIISDLAVTDSLTGLPNRRQFHQMYASTLDDAVEARTPLALMLIDVDHFKQINDEHGHPVGDDRLRDIAERMRTVVRRDDLVARFGGDEFIVVAPRSTRDEARNLAERLRTTVMSSGTSVSIGIAIFPDDAQREDTLIAAADGALYAAKQAGRNCVREAA